MIIIQLREPPISLFVKSDYGSFLKEKASLLSPYLQVTTLKDRKAIIPIGDKTNIAYVRESSDEEAQAMTKPPQNQTIQPPGGLIIGKSGRRPN